MSGKVLDVVGLLATVTLVFAVTACDGDKAMPESEENAPNEALVAEDAGAGVRFELSGKRLRVVVEEESEQTRQLLTGKVDLFCGTREEFVPDGPSALALGRSFHGASEITVELSRNIAHEVAFCGVEAQDGSAEAFGFFIPVEELVTTATS